MELGIGKLLDGYGIARLSQCCFQDDTVRALAARERRLVSIHGERTGGCGRARDLHGQSRAAANNLEVFILLLGHRQDPGKPRFFFYCRNATTASTIDEHLGEEVMEPFEE